MTRQQAAPDQLPLQGRSPEDLGAQILRNPKGVNFLLFKWTFNSPKVINQNCTKLGKAGSNVSRRKPAIVYKGSWVSDSRSSFILLLVQKSPAWSWEKLLICRVFPVQYLDMRERWLNLCFSLAKAVVRIRWKVIHEGNPIRPCFLEGQRAWVS